MTNLLFSGGNNMAGTYLVRFVPVVGVSALPLPAPSGQNAGTVTGNPTFRPGYRWYSVYGTEATKSLIEELQTTDNGPLWSVTIELFLPGDSASQRVTLNQMVRHRFLLEAEDNVGLLRRYGTLLEPFELRYRFDVPGPVGERRGTRITFTGTLTDIPPLVSS